MVTILIISILLLRRMTASVNDIYIKPASNRLMAIDFLIIVGISIVICIASQQLVLISVIVPCFILLRFILVNNFVTKNEINLKSEIPFFIIITLLGAFNDWNSVCNKKIYDYTVPHFFEFTTIPFWMLLYWGMILRAIYSFSKWQYLNPPIKINNSVGIKQYQITNPTIKIISELVLVFITRQFIYNYYLDSLLSWIPFVVALSIWLLFFNVNRHDIKLILIFLIVGPLTEAIYIKIGHLHYYHLGIIYGVPIWIMLWWLVIILIWKDLAPRLDYFITKLISTENKNISFKTNN